MNDWDKIVDRHGPLVWKTACRLLGNAADAADCYQDVFTAALTFARREAVRNWPALLQRLATTQALDRLRRRLRDAARRASVADVDALASEAPSPADVSNDNELMDRLRAALAELPELQARAFWLTGVEDLSYREAAIQLDVEPSHVGVLVHRAKARLRDLMATTLTGNAKGR